MNLTVFGCNLCKLSCPNNTVVQRNKSIEAYACWSLDENDRKSSSSGGLASIFYAHFINNKSGIAYGCSYNNNLNLVFSRASTLQEIEKFKTSKYSFSFIGETFKEVEKDLKNKLNVIFVGTPCQVSGLKSFLRKEYDNLLCIDLICHGMPPEQYLLEYISNLELPEKPDKLTFRGEKNFYFTLYKNNKIIYSQKADNDKYYKAFLQGLFYRENCYSCQYANINRVRRHHYRRFLGIRKRNPV